MVRPTASRLYGVGSARPQRADFNGLDAAWTDRGGRTTIDPRVRQYNQQRADDRPEPILGRPNQLLRAAPRASSAGQGEVSGDSGADLWPGLLVLRCRDAREDR
jgi:hypothetical protein